MIRRRLAWTTLALGSALLSAHSSEAREWWLTTTPTRAGAGDTVIARAWVGNGLVGEPERYVADRARRFVRRDTTWHDLESLAPDGSEHFARFAVVDAGGFMLAYESGFVRLELPAPEFEAYLLREGMESVSRARRRRGHSALPGRERQVRCAKVWVSGDSTARALEPAGLTLELLPLHDPARPGPAAFELRLHGRPLTATLVRMWRRSDRSRPAAPLAAVFQGRTDLDGRIRLPDVGPGQYLVSAVFMEPCREPESADWQSIWSSLTFERTRSGTAGGH